MPRVPSEEVALCWAPFTDGAPSDRLAEQVEPQRHAARGYFGTRLGSLLLRERPLAGLSAQRCRFTSIRVYFLHALPEDTFRPPPYGVPKARIRSAEGSRRHLHVSHAGVRTELKVKSETFPGRK